MKKQLFTAFKIGVESCCMGVEWQYFSPKIKIDRIRFFLNWYKVKFPDSPCYHIVGINGKCFKCGDQVYNEPNVSKPKPCGRLGAKTCKHFDDLEGGCFDCTKHYTQIS